MPAATDSSLIPASEKPLAVQHHDGVTVVVYATSNQAPRRVTHPILPSLHIILVEKGREVEGLTSVLAGYLSGSPSPA